MNKNTIIKKINHGSDWFPKSYSGFLFGIDIQGMGLSKGGEIFPFAQKYGLVYQNHGQKDHWDWFWSTSEMILSRKKILNRVVKSSSFADNFYNAWEEKYNSYIKHFQHIAESNPENFTDKRTHSEFVKLYDLAVKQASYGYVVDSFLTNGEQDWLVEIIKKELGQKATSETINILTGSTFSSFVNDYELSILELAQLINNKQKALSEEKAKEIEKKYFWMKTNYLNYNRLNRLEIISEAKKIKQKDHELAYLINMKQNSAKQSSEKKQTLIKDLGLSKELKNILNVSELFSKIQDRRKECVLRNNTLFYEALERLAKKRKLDRKLIFYTVHDEFFKLLKGKKIDWPAVQDRYKYGTLILYFSGTSTILDYKEISNKINLNSIYPSLNEITELRGSPAFIGVVKGKIRILRNTNEIAKFPKGAILVANQTTPEFVPAMKKAAAIITDQGGITSHAAIVSRELKIPCIVGVKNATQLLKDGDMVELDANKGIIRKI